MKKKQIRENGLRVNEDGFIMIDTRVWTTQAILAEKLNVTRNTVNNRTRRAEAAGLIKTYWIEELGVRLIPNVKNINELSTAEKKQ